LLVERKKQCPRCARERAVGEFHYDSSSVDGLQAVCKPCKREQAQLRRARLEARPAVVTPEEKLCGSCGERKPAADFYCAQYELSGLTSICKACGARKSARRKARLAAREHVRSPPEKACGMCGERKPAEAFSVDRKRLDGLNGRCRACDSVAQAASVYGIDLETAKRLRASRQCDICKTAMTQETLRIDHCHATGRVRGAICGRCNALLGCAKDSQATLASAIEYLRRSAD
jgi:hypothetical protein